MTSLVPPIASTTVDPIILIFLDSPPFLSMLLEAHIMALTFSLTLSSFIEPIELVAAPSIDVACGLVVAPMQLEIPSPVKLVSVDHGSTYSITYNT